MPSDTALVHRPDLTPALIDKETMRLLLALLKHLDTGLDAEVIQMRTADGRHREMEDILRNTLCQLYFNLSRYAKAEGVPFDEEFALKAVDIFTASGPVGEA